MGTVVEKSNNRKTDLLKGGRVPKYDLRVEICGGIDELNSFIGMARAFSEDPEIKHILLRIQNDLLVIGSDLSYPGMDRRLLEKQISDENVVWLRNLWEDFRKSLQFKTGFIIYGATKISSILDVTRAVCRRVERLIVKATDIGIVPNQNILSYVNCLSNVIFALARIEEKSRDE